MALFYVVFAFAAGIALPVQAGVNARLAHVVQSPVRAAFVSFLVGLILLLVASVAIAKPLPSSARLGAAPWWVWTGGVLGTMFILATVIAGPRIGAAALLAAAVAGQMLASLVLDNFGWVGFPQHAVTPGRAVGALLVIAGAVLVRAF